MRDFLGGGSGGGSGGRSGGGRTVPDGGTAPDGRTVPDGHPAHDGDVEPRRPRPWIERIGLAGIALVFAGLFGALALGSWSGGELFLAVMGAIGCFMTLWVGALTLVRG